MNDPIHDQASLSAELSALRSALRDVRAPDVEPALLTAARAGAAAHASVPEPSPMRRPTLATGLARTLRMRPKLALAAAATIAAVAVLVGGLRAERAERAAAASRAAESLMAASAAAANPADVRPAFRPISFPRRLSSAESYSVVRVRLELAASAPGAGVPTAAIEADLLIGEDGLARAIRFDSADTLPVYAAARSANGERR